MFIRNSSDTSCHRWYIRVLVSVSERSELAPATEKKIGHANISPTSCSLPLLSTWHHLHWNGMNVFGKSPPTHPLTAHAIYMIAHESAHYQRLGGFVIMKSTVQVHSGSETRQTSISGKISSQENCWSDNNNLGTISTILSSAETMKWHCVWYCNHCTRDSGTAGGFLWFHYHTHISYWSTVAQLYMVR